MSEPRRLTARRLSAAGVGLILLLAPTQFSLNLAGRVHLTLIEPLLLITGLVFFFDVCFRRRWRELAWPPLEHWLFVLLALLSLTVAEDRFEALKNTLQYGVYFGLLHLMVVDVLRGSRRAPAWGIGLVLAGLVINLALAGMQYFDSGLAALAVRGAFGNRNVLGGYLALMLPLCFALSLFPARPRLRLATALLFPAGLLVLLSGSALLALAAALGLGLLMLGRRLSFAAWTLGLIVLFSTLYPRLPRENNLVMLESVDLYDGMGEPTFRYPEWQVAVNLMHEFPWRGVGAGNYQRQINRYYGLLPNPTGPQEPDIQNLYLVLGVSLGVPGLAAFLAMLVLGVRRAAEILRYESREPIRAIAWGGACGLVSFALAALWSPLLVRGIAPLLAVLLATLHGLRLESADAPGSAGNRGAADGRRSPSHP